LVDSVDGGMASWTPGEVIVQVDPRNFRPSEVRTLLGDAGMTHELMGWASQTGFFALIAQLVRTDYQLAECARHVVFVGLPAGSEA
jgi:GDPmannose 4,6-dehydratase